MKASLLLLIMVLSIHGYGQSVFLDPAFGNNGIVRTNIAPLNEDDERRSIVGLQTDGKILVANNPIGRDPYIIRINPDGSIDPGFVCAVLAKMELSDMLVQADGKIVIAGNVFSQADNTSDFAIARLNNDGSLDPAFGGDGKVISDLGMANAKIYSIALQPDGKIVAAGYFGSISDPEFNGTGVSNFALARYSTNGTLDNGFGTLGTLVTDFPSNRAEAYDVKVQNDGKIVAVGLSGDGGSNPATTFAIARYNTNGTPDNSYTGDGLHTVSVGTTGKSMARALIIQPDGKYVLAGSAVNGSGNYDFAITRLLESGDTDPGFNGGEHLLTDFYGSSDYIFDILLQPDGKIVAGGNVNIILPGGPDSEFGIARYNSNGTPDPGFDADGKLATPIVNNDFITSIVLQTDGAIVAGGYSSMGTGTDISLARYTPGGNLDLSFDVDGKLEYFLPASTDEAKAMAIQDDGKILVSGNYGNTNFSSAAIVRYTQDGELDPGFGIGGKVLLTVGGEREISNAIILQSDGKILVAGGVDNDIAVWRYLNDGSPDLDFGISGRVVTVIPSATGSVNAISLQDDGKIVVAGTAFFGGQSFFVVARYTTTGNPDNGFNGTGYVMEKFVPSHVRTSGNAVVIQPDNKIIVGGFTRLTITGDIEFALARLNTNGSPDLSFNDDGMVSTGLGEFTGLSLQSDNKIVATGSRNNEFAIVRYNTDGSPDNDFGAAGLVTLDLGAITNVSAASVIQPDDKILLVGYAGSSGQTGDFALARINVDGSPDNSFYGDGLITLSFWENFDNTDISERAGSVKLLDNRIYVAGTALSDFVLIVFQNNIVLPLEFLDITALWSGDDVVLKWTTANEEGTSSFGLERSDNGNDFKNIAVLPSANTPGQHYYSYYDKNAKVLAGERLYYRIRQVDLNGQFTYSPVVSVPITRNNTASLYPNPARDKIILEISNDKTEKITWRIIDNQGRVLQNDHRIINPGINQLIIRLNGLAKGIYYLETESKGQRRGYRFVSH